MPQLNTSFICHVGRYHRDIINISDQLTANGWPCVISDDLQNEELKVRINTILDSTWLIYLYDYSKINPMSLLEIGMGLASESTKMIAFIGNIYSPPFSYLTHKKVHLFSDWSNFAARMFIP